MTATVARGTTATFTPAADAIQSLAALAPTLPVPWQLTFHVNHITGGVGCNLFLDSLDQWEAWADHLGERRVYVNPGSGDTHHNATGDVAGVEFEAIFIAKVATP